MRAASGGGYFSRDVGVHEGADGENAGVGGVVVPRHAHLEADMRNAERAFADPDDGGEFRNVMLANALERRAGRQGVPNLLTSEEHVPLGAQRRARRAPQRYAEGVWPPSLDRIS